MAGSISPIPSNSQIQAIGTTSRRPQAAQPKPKPPEDTVQLSPAAAAAAGAEQNNRNK